mmetsp:Transcript_30898/g.95413  ORF Transcript_30898/g.95413 Transcript_30898/m.95413 type:complete len:306 (-) Transcript_30898:1464-2381(-)
MIHEKRAAEVGERHHSTAMVRRAVAGPPTDGAMCGDTSRFRAVAGCGLCDPRVERLKWFGAPTRFGSTMSSGLPASIDRAPLAPPPPPPPTANRKDLWAPARPPLTGAPLALRLPGSACARCFMHSRTTSRRRRRAYCTSATGSGGPLRPPAAARGRNARPFATALRHIAVRAPVTLVGSRNGSASKVSKRSTDSAAVGPAFAGAARAPTAGLAPPRRATGPDDISACRSVRSKADAAGDSGWTFSRALAAAGAPISSTSSSMSSSSAPAPAMSFGSPAAVKPRNSAVKSRESACRSSAKSSPNS